jgi:tetratricopeptide (TPR) repeat protein
MLATIREFAAEQLAGSGEGPDLRRRHAEAFVALAEEAAPHLISVDGAAWNDRLELDHDNLRAALDWAVSSDEGGLGLRLVTALWRFWQVRGHLREGDARIHAVLELPSVADQPPALQARAEGAAGGISYWRSRVPSAHRHYSAALEHARRSGDRALIAEALYDLGFTPLPDALQQLDRLRAGRPLFEEAMALYRELDDPAGIASTTWALSMAAAAEGHPGLALERAAESLALSRRLGDPFRTGWSAHQVGLALLVLDRPDEAVAVFDESLSLWVAAGDKSGIVLLLLDIAMLAGARGRVARRWQLIGAADRGGRETGTDIVNESVEFMGWNPRRTPESDEERTWFAQGAALDLEAAVGLAREELAEP